MMKEPKIESESQFVKVILILKMSQTAVTLESSDLTISDTQENKVSSEMRLKKNVP